MSKFLCRLVCCVVAGLVATAASALRTEAAATPNDATVPKVGLDLTYSGTLTPGRSGQTSGKRFELRYFVSQQSQTGQHTVAFLSQEEGQGSFLWPERFGTLRLDAGFRKIDNTFGPALLYDLEGQPNPVKLPMPFFPHADQIKADARFTVGKDRYAVVGSRKLRNRDCWQIEHSTDFGLKQVLWVEQDGAMHVGVDERVFMVGGQEFRLSMRLESAEQLSDDQLAARNGALQALLALKQQLERAEGSTADTLTRSQLTRAHDALAAIKEKSNDTILGPLAAEIERDVNGQLQREGDLEAMIHDRIGKAAPAFTLRTLGRKTLSSEDLKGKITVLHFWDYRGEPFVEPYGQVGYLDFLYAKRRKQGVQVFGIAVHSRLGTQEQREPLQKIRKLRQFMNLSYPIGLDNGRVLSGFGDPRRVGGKLPLFVVVGPDGKMTHMYSGFYQIKADEGLRPLDEAIDRLRRSP